MQSADVVARWPGFCPICSQNTFFSARNAWFRDHLLCETCDGASIPRERALMLVINQILPQWADLDIHESSPTPRGVSKLLAAHAPGYITTPFWPSVAP